MKSIDGAHSRLKRYLSIGTVSTVGGCETSGSCTVSCRIRRTLCIFDSKKLAGVT